jgi:hypothetical protein
VITQWRDQIRRDMNRMENEAGQSDRLAHEL